MKTLLILAASLGLGLPAISSANCYFVFSPKNDLVYRSVVSPIDLSKPISSGVKSRFNAGHMTMVPDEKGCPDFGQVGERDRDIDAATGPFASPLFRNADSRSTYDENGGITSGTATPPGRRGR